MFFNLIIKSFINNAAQFSFRLIGLLCFFILSTSIFIEKFLIIPPCILCTLQRLLFLLILLACVLYFISIKIIINNYIKKLLTLFYLNFVIIFATLGVMIAARQSWLQLYPNLTIPSCTGGLSDLIKHYSLINIIYMAITGKLECYNVGFRILGLSLANWGLISFIGILSLIMITMMKLLSRRI